MTLDLQQRKEFLLIAATKKPTENYNSGFQLKGGSINPTRIYKRLVAYLMSFKKLLQDTLGAYLLKEWKSTEKENIVLVDETMLPEIFRIHAENFDRETQNKLQKSSKKLRKIFYVIKSRDKIAGYCTYYLKPELSFKGLKKKSVIQSFAIDNNFRGMGHGRKLLEESIKEMKLNRITSVLLYVNVINTPAIKLYEKMNFQIIKEIEEVCGKQEKCYLMELKLA